MENYDIYRNYGKIIQHLFITKVVQQNSYMTEEELLNLAGDNSQQMKENLQYIFDFAEKAIEEEGLEKALRTNESGATGLYYDVSHGAENIEFDWDTSVGDYNYGVDQKALGVIEIPVYKTDGSGYHGTVIVLFGEERMTHLETITEYGNEKTIVSTAKQLQGIVSKWYFILRNFALLVLMLVLIYSGIKIVIGSTAGEKAKYKERLIDWLVAVCLIFIMHYIMIFAVKLVEKITELVSTMQNANGVVIELTDDQETNAKKVLKDFIDRDPDMLDEDANTLSWPTDLAGIFRIASQETEEGTSRWVGYSLCYIVLVLFTLFFAFTYLKRVVYMAFLTMIAPLVAMTYPIDKITDGKAQAFDAWLKEYIFNLMIQPLHLLLYIVLVSSAWALATESPIYALTAIGFMMPAEKLMRKFFGFEKAKTPGLLGGAAGAALAMSGLQSIMKPKSHGGGQDARSGSSKDKNNIKYANKNNVDIMEATAGERPTQRALPQNSIGSDEATDNSDRLRQGHRQRFNTSTNDIDEDDIMQNTTLGSEDWDHGVFNARNLGNTPEKPDIDEDEILGNTTLGSKDWDHEGFGSDNIGGQLVDDIQQPEAISTFEQTKAAREAYNKKTETPLRSFNEEKRTNKANNRRKIVGRIGRATGAVLATSGKQIVGKVLTGFHPLRLAGKIATGATAATAGLLLGVASGDPNKAFQYTTAGAVAGSKLADSLSGRRLLDTEQIKQEAEMAYYGPDYKKKVIDDQRKAFQKDASNISYLRQTMGIGEREAKEILSTTGGKCFDNGITSIEDIATIHKLTNGKDSISFNQAVAARHYAKKRLPANVEQLDSVERYLRRWENEYTRAGYANGKELAKKSFDLAIRFNKAQSSLTKNP